MIYNRLCDLPFVPVSHNPLIQKQVLLSPQDFPPVTQFARATFPPGEIANGHAHPDMLEIFYIEQGTGIIRVDETDYSLEPGVSITVAPGEKHELINNSNRELIVLVIGVILDQRSS